MLKVKKKTKYCANNYTNYFFCFATKLSALEVSCDFETAEDWAHQYVIALKLVQLLISCLTTSRCYRRVHQPHLFKVHQIDFVMWSEIRNLRQEIVKLLEKLKISIFLVVFKPALRHLFHLLLNIYYLLKI